MKKIIILIALVFPLFIHSQIMNEKYLLFSNDKKSEYLTIENDSILKIKPIFNGGIYFEENYKEKKFHYKISKDSISILQFENNTDIRFKIGPCYLENADRKEIYVIRDDFKSDPGIAYRYKNKTYWHTTEINQDKIFYYDKLQDIKTRNQLKKIVKKIPHEHFQMNRYHGYDAFYLFGYSYVFGIIEIKDLSK